MAQIQTKPPQKSKLHLQKVFQAGLLAGALDITAALLTSYFMHGVKPTRVFRYIASGIFGKDAFDGSAMMIVWGVLFHFLIALIFALLFFLLYSRLKFLSINIFLSGIGYGIFAWLVMHFIVVPLSNVPGPRSSNLQGIILQLMFHMFLIGLPIAFIIHKWCSGRTKIPASL